jgi:hypothetical protein
VHDGTGAIARISSYYADGEPVPVGGKIFPRRLSIHREGTTTAEVNITELSAPAKFPLGTFTPPSGCGNRHRWDSTNSEAGGEPKS